MHCLWDANLPLIFSQMYEIHLSIVATLCQSGLTVTVSVEDD
jgi:hypothetical protein